MAHSATFTTATAAACGALLALAACAPPSHEERVAALRSRYSAEFNGFIVRETPLVEEGVDGAEAAATEEEFEPAPLEVRQDLLLDLLVMHDSDERLPGVTVDVTMVDSSKVEKARWRVWVDTSDLAKATHKQISHEVSDVDYQEGDGFYAEVVADVAPEERGEYREFAESGG